MEESPPAGGAPFIPLRSRRGREKRNRVRPRNITKADTITGVTILDRHRCAQSIWRYVRLVIAFCFVALWAISCGPPPAGQPGARSLVIQQPPRARLTYVAIGASDTFGVGADDPQTQSWPDDLAAKLGPGVRLINLGIPGITLHQALDVEVPVSLDAHPNLVTVWLAVNDLVAAVPVASYAHDLDLLVGRVQKAAPQARIAIANVPDLTLLPYFSSVDPQNLHSEIQSYNAAIASVAQQHHILLVDLFAQWRELHGHPEDISADGLHPSTVGYSQIAGLFYQALQVAP
jgi:lysophospholipase L1-like esterase